MEDIIKIFEKTGALRTGHFSLTSGLHSPTYFQCALVLQHPEYCTLIAGKIAENFSNQNIDVVISPAIGGIVVGQEVGRQLGVRTIFSEREQGVMKLRRGFDLRPGERVLVCEDVVTTGGSVFEVLEIVKKSQTEIAGVGYIVDRSDGQVKFSDNQFSLVQLSVESYEPDSCPLCKKNVPVNKPGSRNV
jgi:orotate phosphoribosyltransferase